jgi:hypothetical protein
LSRPNIPVRAVRARFAALALGSLGTFSLAVVPAAALPVSGGAGTPAGAAIAPTAPQGPNDPFAVSAAPRPGWRSGGCTAR